MDSSPKPLPSTKRIATNSYSLPEEIRPLEKLADLYVQQGVMSEARPASSSNWLKFHLKNTSPAGSRRLIEKNFCRTEPDNLRIQIRLADLYQAWAQRGKQSNVMSPLRQRALAARR